MVNELNDLIQDILMSNQGLLTIAIRQRAKFEGWLKFELAQALSRKYADTRVEYHARETNCHIDLYANDALIELKTPNTNYPNPLCENHTRPITKNITSIIDDIEKLKGFPKKGYIAFVMFPLDSGQAYRQHTNKVVACLRNHLETIVTIQGVPVLVFTGEV